ncbi:MAG: T9SS type A sorting domain-containing protein [Bacteroidetes bacterium]|nr:T9SS type A sorting domain-containing protein [Bacteroidota bacterium]
MYYYITGISDFSDELNSYIKIIPNPATNKFVIHFNDYVEKGRVEIIDVFTGVTQSNQIEIDQLKLASGVYYVNFTNGEFHKKGKFVYSNF